MLCSVAALGRSGGWRRRRLLVEHYLLLGFTPLDVEDVYALRALTRLQLLSVDSVSSNALPLLRQFSHLELFVCRNTTSMWITMAQIVADATDEDLAALGISAELRALQIRPIEWTIPAFDPDDPVFQAHLADLREVMPNCRFDIAAQD